MHPLTIKKCISAGTLIIFLVFSEIQSYILDNKENSCFEIKNGLPYWSTNNNTFSMNEKGCQDESNMFQQYGNYGGITKNFHQLSDITSLIGTRRFHPEKYSRNIRHSDDLRNLMREVRFDEHRNARINFDANRRFIRERNTRFQNRENSEIRTSFIRNQETARNQREREQSERQNSRIDRNRENERFSEMNVRLNVNERNSDKRDGRIHRFGNSQRQRQNTNIINERNSRFDQTRSSRNIERVNIDRLDSSRREVRDRTIARVSEKDTRRDLGSFSSERHDRSMLNTRKNLVDSLRDKRISQENTRRIDERLSRFNLGRNLELEDSRRSENSRRLESNRDFSRERKMEENRGRVTNERRVIERNVRDPMTSRDNVEKFTRSADRFQLEDSRTDTTRRESSNNRNNFREREIRMNRHSDTNERKVIEVKERRDSDSRNNAERFIRSTERLTRSSERFSSKDTRADNNRRVSNERSISTRQNIRNAERLTRSVERFNTEPRTQPFINRNISGDRKIENHRKIDNSRRQTEREREIRQTLPLQRNIRELNEKRSIRYVERVISLNSKADVTREESSRERNFENNRRGVEIGRELDQMVRNVRGPIAESNNLKEIPTVGSWFRALQIALAAIVLSQLLFFSSENEKKRYPLISNYVNKIKSF